MQGLSLKAYILLLSIVFCSAACAADMAVTPAVLEMGFRLASQNSTSQAVAISNTGSADLAITSTTISGGGADAFSATAGTCPSLTPTLAPGISCTINIAFAPGAGQDYSATLAVAANSTVTPLVNVPLSGGGAYPLNLFIASSTGTGTVSVAASAPVDAGLSCAADAAYCAAYPGGTSITLTPQPSRISAFAGWSGCAMTMGDSCFISINGAVNATAAFSLARLQSLLNTAVNGEVINVPIANYTEAVVMTRPVLLTLSGGWIDQTFVSQAGFTAISGSLTIAAGTLIIENIELI